MPYSRLQLICHLEKPVRNTIKNNRRPGGGGVTQCSSNHKGHKGHSGIILDLKHEAAIMVLGAI